MLSKDLEKIKLAEFQQPIRCCNVTAIAYALTALGHPTTIDEIFYATRLPIASVLDDGMTLSETYDTCVKYIENMRLPLSAEVEHFDKDTITLDSFLKELEKAVMDEDDIHILNFNAKIAHNNKNLEGGHFSLLADYDPITQEMTIADTNPKRYTRLWKCPAQRMYEACVDKDSSCDRSRGTIVLRKIKNTQQIASVKSTTQLLKIGEDTELSLDKLLGMKEVVTLMRQALLTELSNTRLLDSAEATQD